jgi:hypothetical protein
MVTEDVGEEGKAQLATVFDRVIDIDYLSTRARKLRTQKQQEKYHEWVDAGDFLHSFIHFFYFPACTKWNCLKLVEYEKVLLVDADKIVLSNCDEIFQLPAPAGTFSSPWAKPFAKGVHGIHNPYRKDPRRPAVLDNLLEHGDQVALELTSIGLDGTPGPRGQWQPSFVLIGTFVLLQPDMHMFRTLQDILAFHQDPNESGSFCF